MIDLYPNAEQIWFIRDLFHREQAENQEITESEKDLILKLRPLLQDVEKQCAEIVNLTEGSLDAETNDAIREQLDPFNRSGEIFLNAGHFSEYGSNKLHERLHDILILVDNVQQGKIDDKSGVQNEIQGFLTKLAEKLGVSGIVFDNSQNSV